MNARARALRLLPITGLLVGPVAVFACTGDDPTFVAPSSTPDAATAADTSPAADAGSDAPAGECGDDCDLVTGQTPREIVVDGTHVYWASTEGIMRADKKRKGAPVETLAAGLAMPRGLAVTPSYVFWLTGAPCAEIHRRSSASGAITKVPAGIGIPLRSVFVDKVLYYSGQGAASGCVANEGKIGGGIHFIDEDLTDGGAIKGFVDGHACQMMSTRGIAARKTGANVDLVWAHDEAGELCWAVRGSYGLQEKSWAGVSRIVLSDDSIFWTSKEGVHWQKRATDEELAVPATAVSTVGDATGLVHDEARRRLYFVTRGGKVYRAEGNAAQVIAEPECEAGALAQDEEFLYLTCEAQGTIKRLKKP